MNRRKYVKTKILFILTQNENRNNVVWQVGRKTMICSVDVAKSVSKKKLWIPLIISLKKKRKPLNGTVALRQIWKRHETMLAVFANDKMKCLLAAIRIYTLGFYKEIIL